MTRRRVVLSYIAHGLAGGLVGAGAGAVLIWVGSRGYAWREGRRG